MIETTVTNKQWWRNVLVMIFLLILFSLYMGLGWTAVLGFVIAGLVYGVMGTKWKGK